MKALFGGVSLLIALAVVGMLVAKQMRSGVQADSFAAVPAAALPASATLRAQSQQLQQQVQSDVTQALEQGAARIDRADQ